MKTFDVPSGWRRSRLRFLLQRSPTAEQKRQLSTAQEVSFAPMEAIGQNGEIDFTLTKDKEEVSSGYTLFFDGDVVVAKITPCFENGKGALVRDTLNGVGFGTTELHALSPTKALDSRFLYYITASPLFRKLGEAGMTGAAGQKRVTDEFVQNYRVAVPTILAQKAIADFLDRETARIDALISAKERLLEIMAEKRLALITHAVTRGLDLNAPMRDSGIPWLGDIPEHWQTERARWLFRERDERSSTGDEELLTVSHITGVTPRSAKAVNMFEAETTEGYKICRQGDLVINTMWAWMGAMGVSPLDGIVSPAYNVYIPGDGLTDGYVDALVRTRQFIQEATRFSKGVWSSRLRLYPEEFFRIVLPVPTLDEQEAIVEYIESETRRLDALRAATERTIGLLKERRASLIAEAVTGQLEVD